MKHRLFTFCLAVLASVGMAKASYYGSCTEDIWWRYDSELKVLTIGGEGEIPSTGEGGCWCQYEEYDIRSNVKHVIISSGITALGAYNFYYHPSLETVEIAGTVREIGYDCFGERNNLYSIKCYGTIPPHVSEFYLGVERVPLLYYPKGYSENYSEWKEWLCQKWEEFESEDIEDPGEAIPTVYTQLPDTTICFGTRAYIGNNATIFYNDGVMTAKYTSAAGGDSIVSRNVYIKTVQEPYIVVNNNPNELNSGYIRIYDAYKYNYEENENRAKYDYITINGERYDHKPAEDAAVLSLGDGSNPVDDSFTPSFELKNLPQGTYTIQFYLEDCNNTYAEEVYTLNAEYINIDGLYYNIYHNGWFSREGYMDYAEVTHAKPYNSGNFTPYYDDKIVIPDTITLGDKKYPVKVIGSNAFQNSNYLTSLIIPKPVMNINSYAFSNCSKLTEIFLYTDYAPDASSSTFSNMADGAYFYVPFARYNYYTYTSYWKDRVRPAVKATTEVGPTNCKITFEGLMDETVTACAIKDGEKEEGNVLEYIGLTPSSTYSNVEVVVYNADDASATLKVSFTTESIKLITLESKATSASVALLLAETNIDPAETNCGFEWKRNDAPSDMKAKKEYATIKNGIMAGRLMGLRDDVYYKYRAFYTSATGSTTYGAWEYIFTGDVSVSFEPILYTEPAQVHSDREATLRGYALAGSEEITEQGFEYWIDSRANVQTANGPRYAPAAHEHYIIEVSGIAMEVTLTDLDPGTVYHYRAYAKAGGQVFYGAELSFITRGVYTGEEDPTGMEDVQTDVQSTKILRDGQLFILRGDKVYTITGMEVR